MASAHPLQVQAARATGRGVRHNKRPCALGLALVLATAAVQAQQGLEAEHRTWLQLYGTAGRWHMVNEGTDLFGVPASTPLQAEAQLGLPRQHAFAGIAFGRRIGQNWRIELDRTSASRSGNTVLATDLVSDGTTFAAGTALRTQISLTTLRINGGWSLLHTADQEAGISFGGQWLSVTRRLDGQHAPVAGTLAPASVRGSDVAPIAIVGGYGSVKLGSAWRLSGRLELGVGSDKLQQWQVGAQWQATPNLALQAGYRATRADVDLVFGFIACCSRMKLDYRVHGPSLALDLSF